MRPPASRKRKPDLAFHALEWTRKRVTLKRFFQAHLSPASESFRHRTCPMAGRPATRRGQPQGDPQKRPARNKRSSRPGQRRRKPSPTGATRTPRSSETAKLAGNPGRRGVPQARPNTWPSERKLMVAVRTFHCSITVMSSCGREW